MRSESPVPGRSTTTLLSLPAGDEARIVALRDEVVFALLTLKVRRGRVEHIHAVADPAKLTDLAVILDA